MKILICQFGNETNSFSLGKTTWETLVSHGWIEKETVLNLFEGTASYVGGAIRAMREEGVEPLPIDLATKGGNFGAGPTMSMECARYAMDHITEQVKEHLSEIDGVFFAVHGAGRTETEEDLESYCFRRMRSVIGDLPMMSSLDAHANLSHDMVALSDGLFGIKTVPHVDCEEAGYRAASVLIQTIRGELKPQMALCRLPLLIPATTGFTLSGVGKEILEHNRLYREEHGLLDVTFFFGFSATDAHCSSCSVLVVADGYDPIAEAEELAEFVWERKSGFEGESLSCAEALSRAEAQIKEGYAVVNEASDNPGGGAPGDATHLLREMLRRNQKGYVMGPLYDPEAAGYIHENCRVGDRISIAVGGKTDPRGGEPIELEDALVVNLSDGKLISAAPINRGVAMDYGKSVRLRQGNVELILVSDRFQTYDDRPFLMTGCDLSQARVLGLKSMNHFKGYFQHTADAIVTADPPGVCPIDLKQYDYQNLCRPILPLDDEAEIPSFKNWGKKEGK
ncbi:MAG: M81 family metallopeptidase [Clostridia bacterium]|nr:M81 family metallopeptidase [Clostridia bacterium]